MKKHTIWKCQHPHNWDPIHLLSTTQGKLIWLMWRSGGMGERLTFIHYTHRPSNRRFMLDLCFLPLFSFGRILWIYSHSLHARGPVRKEKGGHCLQLYPLPCEPRLYGTFRKCCRNSPHYCKSPHRPRRNVCYFISSEIVEDMRFPVQYSYISPLHLHTALFSHPANARSERGHEILHVSWLEIFQGNGIAGTEKQDSSLELSRILYEFAVIQKPPRDARGNTLWWSLLRQPAFPVWIITSLWKL